MLLEGNWDEYRDNYNISGTKNLFMIPFESDVTEADIRKTEQVLDFYVGGLEGITEANKYSLIDMFTDSGFRHGTYRLITQLVDQAEWRLLIGQELSRYWPLIGPELSRYWPLIGPDLYRYLPLIGPELSRY